MAQDDVQRRMTVEFTETLGEWRWRLVMIAQDDEGLYQEPYVVQGDLYAPELAGLGWQASGLLYEAWRTLDGALRDGYE